jgi:MFS family permease
MGGLKPVAVLLLAIFILMAGGGSLTTLISVRLQDAEVSASSIGAVATAYFAGLTLGSFTVFRIIARVGHIRAFAAFVSLFSASALVYALHLDIGLWSLLRVLEGFCIAGVYVCLESWLNDKAPSASRGSVLAFYMVALYAGQAAGQFLLTLNAGSPAFPFVAASMLLSLAVVPVALTHQAPPQPPPLVPLNVRALYRASPLGFVGAVSNGVMLGAFYGLGAVFARRIGLDAGGAATFMSAAILGGVALQWPLGRASDMFDRRLVIVAVLAAISGLSAILAVSADLSAPVRLVVVALFGGMIFALYPLCVAHTNDHLSAEERVAASGGLILSYSVGAMAGPVLASTAMGLIGPGGVFLTTGAAGGLTLVYALRRLIARASAPSEDQQPYLVMPRTTPAAALLDPIAAEEQPGG